MDRALCLKLKTVSAQVNDLWCFEVTAPPATKNLVLAVEKEMALLDSLVDLLEYLERKT